MNPWRARGQSIEAPPEAWRWAAVLASRAARAAGWPPAARAFVDALNEASQAPTTHDVPSPEQPRPGAARVMLVDVEDAADQLGCSPELVRRRCRAGRIEGAVKVGRTWAIPATSIDRRTPKEQA